MSKITKFLGRDQVEVIPATKKLTLDEAYKIACKEGKVEIGGIFSSNQASINMNQAGHHFISVKCADHDLITNLMQCVEIARRIRSVL